MLVGVSLLLIPISTSAQAPSPEESLAVVLEHLRDVPEVFRDWHLGVDPAWTTRVYREAVVDPVSHREILARISEARELPFYPGEDFGRVICDASPDPDRLPVNCRFSHGTRSMLGLIVVSSDGERGITQIHALSRLLNEVAIWRLGEIMVGSPSRTIMLEVEYAPGGAAQVMTERSVTVLRSGALPIDEIRGSPHGR